MCRSRKGLRVAISISLFPGFTQAKDTSSEKGSHQFGREGVGLGGSLPDKDKNSHERTM